ncbi:class I SAM-dependent methyltransferase [candidate division WOR-3 bacterium]|nr:class I SAM-dependent methyltransferase [candidate division WOR-3 bacterium]
MGKERIYNDILMHNKYAWNKAVDSGDEWTVPVSREIIEEAKKGNWKIFLTPLKPVPKEWSRDLRGLKVLCLASGGGQQGPLFSALGADVTVFDNSPKQLMQDQYVAERDSLKIKTVEGDMADLSCFENEMFDLIFHPVSNSFVPDILPVWMETYRVLKRNGILLSGFANPLVYLFDSEKMEQDVLEVKHKIPYSSAQELTDEEKKIYFEKGYALEFSHTLDDQIGGQIKAGFVVNGFYEDYHNEGILSKFIPSYIATRAVKQ